MANTTLKKSAAPKVAKKLNPAKPQETKSTIRFSAKLSQPEATERANKKTSSWTLVTLPKNASAKLPSPQRDMTMVEGTINGFAFRTALVPNGNGIYELRLSKALQEAAGAEIGDTVTVEITRIGEESECRVPMDLRKALDAAPSAQAVWTDITPMARRDWVLSIIAVKQEETRTRRIEMTCDMLASGKRRPCCFPGINWRRKDSDVTSDETWLPLGKAPSSKSRSSASRAKSTK
jgi:hypothetical protein